MAYFFLGQKSAKRWGFCPFLEQSLRSILQKIVFRPWTKGPFYAPPWKKVSRPPEILVISPWISKDFRPAAGQNPGVLHLQILKENSEISENPGSLPLEIFEAEQKTFKLLKFSLLFPRFFFRMLVCFCKTCSILWFIRHSRV